MFEIQTWEVRWATTEPRREAGEELTWTWHTLSVREESLESFLGVLVSNHVERLEVQRTPRITNFVLGTN